MEDYDNTISDAIGKLAKVDRKSEPEEHKYHDSGSYEDVEEVPEEYSHSNNNVDNMRTEGSLYVMEEPDFDDIDNTPNELHIIREKEKKLRGARTKRIVRSRNLHIERKQLSSAYARKHPRTTLEKAVPVNTMPVATYGTGGELSDLDLPSFGPSKDEHLYSEQFHSMGERKVYFNEKQESVQRRAPGEERTVATYFTPSLAEICATVIAENFEMVAQDISKMDKKSQKAVTSKLPVDLPVQLIVPHVDDEDFWKRCCQMRWSDGQLGVFTKTRGDHLLNIRESLMDKFKSVPKSKDMESMTWKHLYLERNLQEFLESIQSQESIAQELHILNLQPTKEEAYNAPSNMLVEFKTKNVEMRNDIEDRKQAKLLKEQAAKNKRRRRKEEKKNKQEKNMEEDTPKEGGDVKKTPEKPVPEPIEQVKTKQVEHEIEEEVVEEKTAPVEDPRKYVMHSHQMRPTLNYYLLHDENPTNETIRKFREKLSDLFDGSESTRSSRLNTLSKDDDIFTFYDNAIHRSYYKTHNHRNQFAFNNIQYWLLSKKDKVDNDEEVQDTLNFVMDQNRKRTIALYNFSCPFIQHLEITTLRSHIDLIALFKNLPELKHLRLTYGVRNAGMSFSLDMMGIQQNDIKSIADALADPKLTPKLTSLHLPENLIDDHLLKGLLVGILKNDRLKDIDLSHNKISRDGALALSAYLRKNQTLERLNLSDNLIRSQGGAYLATALKNNTSLVSLNLRFNRLSDNGGKSIISVLGNHPQLQELILANNELGPKSMSALVNIIPNVPKLVSYDISGNILPNEAGPQLLSAIEKNKEIVNFDIRRCGLQTSDSSKIRSLLRQNANKLSNILKGVPPVWKPRPKQFSYRQTLSSMDIL